MLVRRAVRVAVRVAVRYWVSLQVELRGKYSVERLWLLQRYTDTTSAARALALGVAAPIPALIMVIGPDLLPLEPPERGFAHSRMFWIRTTIVALVSTFSVVQQCHFSVPELAISTRLMVAIPILSTIASVTLSVCLSRSVGFPVPFLVMFMAGVSVVTVNLVLLTLRYERLRQSPTVRSKLTQFRKVMALRAVMLYVYQGYAYVFYRLSGTTQTAFAVVLPVIKLLQKNWMNPLIADNEDAKPETVTFFVEVFHSLFTTSCLQGSTSLHTSLVIISFDLVLVFFSLRDVFALVNSAQQCLEKAITAQPPEGGAKPSDQAVQIDRIAAKIDCVKAVHYLLQNEPEIRAHSMIRLRSTLRGGQRMRSGDVVGPSVLLVNDKYPAVSRFDSPLAADAVAPPKSALSSILPEQLRKNLAHVMPLPGTGTDPNRDLVSEDERRALLSMSDASRLEYVVKVLQALHVAEFVLLIEFTEVMIPFTHCIFLVSSFYLSNRAYYSWFQSSSAEDVGHVVSTVLLYTAFEAASMALVAWSLQRRLRISPLHQVVFVLDTQWREIQSKLVLSLVFALSSTLEHYGTDYSFQFAWLRSSPQT